MSRGPWKKGKKPVEQREPKIYGPRYAARQVDEDAICLARARALNGRTIQQVDDLHRTALASLPRRSVHGWKALDPAAVRRVISYLEEHVIPDCGPSVRGGCSWGRLTETMAQNNSARKPGCE